MKPIAIAFFLAAAVFSGGCGSGGGTATPPAPPGPVAPPPPPPEPTFEERLADLAAHDPNGCRAKTPGFEALGGWLKDSEREIGDSRVWIRDTGGLDAPVEQSHGARVKGSFDDCAVREIARYLNDSGSAYNVTDIKGLLADEDESPGQDMLISASFGFSGVSFHDEPLDWFNLLNHDEDAEYNLMLVLALGNDNGNPTNLLDEGEYAVSLTEALKSKENRDNALWIVVGGYTGTFGDANDAPSYSESSTCGKAEELCLFAPWTTPYSENLTACDGGGCGGTSHATPQVAAALDTVWAVWPNMKVLDLRNLAFECAKNMAVEGAEGTTRRTYSYLNNPESEFTSFTNSTWGHGILSLTCLFTPNGGLQNPVTGDPISGGIYGPVAGPVTGASITGFDYTGRNFGYGFARPLARPNYALAATANLRPAQAISRPGRPMAGAAAFSGSLWRSGAFGVDLTAAGNAIGAAAGWQAGNWTLRGGLALQPEGAGSLTGSRAFRAPATASAAITAAYAKGLRGGFSVHLQADHWRTLAAQGRSLWENAELTESRISAGLARRAGDHEVALQAVWQSGVRGALRVAGRDWRLAGIRESGVWLTWRKN